MEANKTKKRYRLNFKKLIILVLFVYLIFAGFNFVMSRPVRMIVINGTTLICDSEIIRIANLMDSPSIFRISPRNLEGRISEIDLVDNVRVARDRHFRLVIEVEEAKVVFYNSINNMLMLSSGRYVENDRRLLGIPTLINFAPEVILNEFAANLGTLDYGTLSLISEIEYSTMISSEGLTIDETRFVLYMNDGNHVYTNAGRAGNLAFYQRIFASLGGQQGVIYLDSLNNFIFRDFASLNNEE